MSCRRNRQIPGSNLNLPEGEDYDSPVKRSRLQFMQAEHIQHEDIAELEDEEGPMPDTLRIGIRTRYFAIAPNDSSHNEWIAYTMFHLYDRLINYWNILMYFCLDGNSENRLNTARSVKYYGVPPANPLPKEIKDQVKNPDNYCKFDKEWYGTAHDPEGCNAIDTYPQYVEKYIEHLLNIRSDPNLMPGIDEEFPSDYMEAMAPTYKNIIPFFSHVYRKHYRGLCGMGILYHFNSFFMNIIHQGFVYKMICEKDIDDEYVYNHYKRIYKEEELRVKGGV